VDTELDTGAYIASNVTDGKEVTIASRTDANTLVTADLGGGATWDAADVYYIAAEDGTGFCLDMYAAGSTYNVPAGDYEFAQSFIYHGNQESLLRTMPGPDFTIADGESFNCTVTFHTTNMDETLMGGRIYTRIAGSDGDWILFLDIDFRKGARANLTSDFSGSTNPWVLFNSSLYANSPGVRCSARVDELNVETYNMINGFSPNTDNITIAESGMGYKAAVIGGNRRMYVANVKMRDDNNEVVVNGDMMLKSPPNKFDTFLWDDRVEVVINDGDDITALAYFNDRILQFKRNSVYVINVGKEYEVLEDTLPLIGIEGQHQVVTTDKGVLWVNVTGIFFYDGRTVTNFIYREGERVFEWLQTADGGILPTTLANMAIGYIPKNNYVFIVLDTGANGQSDIVIVNLLTGAIVYGLATIANSTNTVMSNLVNDIDGNLVYCLYNTSTPDTVIKYFDETAGGGRPIVQWGAMSFGEEGDKTAYEFGVRSKGLGATADVALAYRTDDLVAFQDVGADLPDNANLTRDVRTPSAHISGFKYMAVIVYTETADVDSDFELEAPDLQIRMKSRK